MRSGYQKRGYTLLELIVTLLVIAVLSAIAIPAFAVVQERSLAGSLAEQANSIARNANAIAASDRSAGGTVSYEILLAAALEADPNPPGGTNTYILLSRQSGNASCRVAVALTASGRAEPGPVSCGGAALALPAGALEQVADPGDGSSLTATYPTAGFPPDVWSQTTRLPSITGAADRLVELGPGCDFGTDYFPQALWESYGVVPEDCDAQGGAWLLNYTKVEPDITASIVAGSLPDGFQFDSQTGALTSPADVVQSDPRLPFTLVIRFSTPTGSEVDVTQTFVEDPNS